jgi:hypothetical protein
VRRPNGSVWARGIGGVRDVTWLVWLVALAACAPRVRPLVGLPAPAQLPATALPPGHARVVFRWVYGDPIFSARGEGVARIAPPDSVRLDFFADGGVGGGFAILIGDRLTTPANDDARKYLPPVPLLWAALGRLQVNGTDTVAVMRGDSVQADIGRSPVWRAAFHGDTLVELQRIEGQRLRERVQRVDSVVSYRNYGSRRRLTLTLTRRIVDLPYDASIWIR